MSRIGTAVAALSMLVAAAVLAMPQGSISRYMIVSGDSSMSGSWNSNDEPRINDLRAKFGSHFAVFWDDGHEYAITSDEILAELDTAMAPQRDVNRQQSDVNHHQSEVNRMQGDVNRLQQDVNRDQAEVNRAQSEVNHGGGSQSEVNRLQSKVNAEQRDVNAE